jgi:hypothetical protein
MILTARHRCPLCGDTFHRIIDINEALEIDRAVYRAEKEKGES